MKLAVKQGLVSTPLFGLQIVNLSCYLYLKIALNSTFSGEERNISLTVKSSKDYPLDVYYLMDFSFSMKEDLANLKELTSNISEYFVVFCLMLN